VKEDTGRDTKIIYDGSRSGAEISANEDQRRKHVDRYLHQFPNLDGLHAPHGGGVLLG
jgi:hypothetical protein